MFIIAFLIFPFSVGSHPQESFELNDVSLNTSEIQVEIVLELSNKIEFESFTLFNPSRLILDLLGIRNFSNSPLINVNSMGIKSLRTAKYQPDVTRFIIDFEDTIPQYSIDQSGNNISIILKSEVEQPAQKKEEIIQEEKPSIEAPATKPTEQQNVKKPAEEKSKKKKASRKKKESNQAEEAKSDITKKTSIAFGPQAGFYSLHDRFLDGRYIAADFR